MVRTQPKKKTNLDSLTQAIHRDRRVLTRYRQERREAVREYVGFHWSDEGSAQMVPINLISKFVTTVSRVLISHDPRFSLTTDDKKQKPHVATMQDDINKRVKRMGLGESLSRVVYDGLFSLGCGIVALATPADAAKKSWRLQAGQPYFGRVDLDDLAFDTRANEWPDVAYIAHRYEVPLDAVRDSSLYNKNRKLLTASTEQPYNREGDERIGILGRSYWGQPEGDFDEQVVLWNVWYPRTRTIITLADDLLGGAETLDDAAIREVDWLGPDCGPYHMLGYNVVPGNLMPKAPVQDLMDLHVAVNRIIRKLIRQAWRQKGLLGVQAGATEDAARINQADDGEAVQVNNPDKVKELMYGGPNPMNFQLGQYLSQQFDQQAGGIDLLAGTNAPSPTAAQDKMLNENSSRQIGDMQDQTVKYTAQVGEAICWYLWKHPVNVGNAPLQIPNAPGVVVPRKVTPQQRATIPFDSLDLAVDPYSLQHKTPQQRLAFVNNLVTNMMPMMQMLQQRGIMFDANRWMQLQAEWGNEPAVAELFTMQEPPPPEDASAGGGGGPGMPAQTSREYIRRSAGQDSKANESANLKSQLQSAGAQMRPGGARM